MGTIFELEFVIDCCKIHFNFSCKTCCWSFELCADIADRVALRREQLHWVRVQFDVLLTDQDNDHDDEHNTSGEVF